MFVLSRWSSNFDLGTKNVSFLFSTIGIFDKRNHKKRHFRCKKNKIRSRNLYFKHSFNVALFTTFSEILAKSLVIFGLRDGWPHQNRWIFAKVPKGERGSFSIQIKFKLQILYLSTGLFEHEVEGEKIATWFSKMRGGGVSNCQRLYGTFPKIRLFWCGHPSFI